MKSILIATVIGMICFQSCTKENTVQPVNAATSTNNEDQISKKNVPHPIKNSNVPIEKDEKTIIIKCGTEIPNSPVIKYPRKSATEPTKPGKQTPPIYVPKFPNEVK